MANEKIGREKCGANRGTAESDSRHTRDHVGARDYVRPFNYALPSINREGAHAGTRSWMDVEIQLFLFMNVINPNISIELIFQEL